MPQRVGVEPAAAVLEQQPLGGEVLAVGPQLLEPVAGVAATRTSPCRSSVLQHHAQRALEHPGAQVAGAVEAVVDVGEVVLLAARRPWWPR